MLIPKTPVALEEAVKAGVLYGYRRAFKHNESPDENVIIDAIQNAVIESIYERFDLT